MGDGILLKPKKPFAETTLAQGAGCLKYAGVPKSLEEIDAAIRQDLALNAEELFLNLDAQEALYGYSDRGEV